MKKIKRLLALFSAVLLICMYGGTLVFALIGTPAANDMFLASVAATILVPVLLYGFSLVADLLKQDDSHSPEGTGQDTDSSDQ